jgi:hypothetical protein
MADSMEPNHILLENIKSFPLMENLNTSGDQFQYVQTASDVPSTIY